MSQHELTIDSVKRIQGKAVLTLSNGETISMPRAMLRERPYRHGMPFERVQFDTFLKERSAAFAMDKAVGLLASRARTEREIVESLRKNAYPETAIAKVMAKLSEAGYINDTDFARNWTQARTGKGFGARRIRMELHGKGVSQQEIDDAMSAIDEDDQFDGAVKAALKAARGRDLSSPAERQKVIAALVRRGFDFSLARHALSEIQQSDR